MKKISHVHPAVTSAGAQKIAAVSGKKARKGAGVVKKGRDLRDGK